MLHNLSLSPPHTHERPDPRVHTLVSPATRCLYLNLCVQVLSATSLLSLVSRDTGCQAGEYPDSLPNPASSSLRDSRQRSFSFHIYKVMAKSVHPRLVRIQGNGFGGRETFNWETQLESSPAVKRPTHGVTFGASCLWKIGFQSAQRLDGKYIFLLPSWR